MHNALAHSKKPAFVIMKQYVRACVRIAESSLPYKASKNRLGKGVGANQSPMALINQQQHELSKSKVWVYETMDCVSNECDQK